MDVVQKLHVEIEKSQKRLVFLLEETSRAREELRELLMLLEYASANVLR